MCQDHGTVHIPSVRAIPADAEWTGEVLPLEPVDELRILTVCDNTVDMLLLDEGPARRLPLGGSATGGAPGEDGFVMPVIVLPDGPEPPRVVTLNQPWYPAASGTGGCTHWSARSSV